MWKRRVGANRAVVFDGVFTLALLQTVFQLHEKVEKPPKPPLGIWALIALYPLCLAHVHTLGFWGWRGTAQQGAIQQSTRCWAIEHLPGTGQQGHRPPLGRALLHPAVRPSGDCAAPCRSPEGTCGSTFPNFSGCERPTWSSKGGSRKHCPICHHKGGGVPQCHACPAPGSSRGPPPRVKVLLRDSQTWEKPKPARRGGHGLRCGSCFCLAHPERRGSALAGLRPPRPLRACLRFSNLFFTSHDISGSPSYLQECWICSEGGSREPPLPFLQEEEGSLEPRNSDVTSRLSEEVRWTVWLRRCPDWVPGRAGYSGASPEVGREGSWLTLGPVHQGPEGT